MDTGINHGMEEFPTWYRPFAFEGEMAFMVLWLRMKAGEKRPKTANPRRRRAWKDASALWPPGGTGDHVIGQFQTSGHIPVTGHPYGLVPHRASQFRKWRAAGQSDSTGGPGADGCGTRRFPETIIPPSPEAKDGTTSPGSWIKKRG